MVLVVPDCFDNLVALEAGGQFLPPVIERDRLSFMASGIDIFMDNPTWSRVAKDQFGFVDNVCYVFKRVKSSRRHIHIYDRHLKAFTNEVRELDDPLAAPFQESITEFFIASYSISPYGQLEWWIEAESFELHIPEQNIEPGSPLPPGAYWIDGPMMGGRS